MDEEAFRRHNICQIKVAQRMAKMTILEVIETARKYILQMDSVQHRSALKLSLYDLCRAELMKQESHKLNR